MNIGLVAIGRNEGPRLRKCLESARGRVRRTVYVDSGSTDDSLDIAREQGVEIVNLDTSISFTAARARNEGARRLLELEPDLKYIQFVDGDCELVPQWWNNALAVLEQRPELATICGRRRERNPQHSIYNQLCDIEWNTPVGDALACGGDSIMRVEAFKAVGGFNPLLIAGEEPDLCLRLRQAGWKIHRLDAEMTLHDAAMTRFSQWWRREKRAGYAAAEGAAMHGRLPERYRRKMANSNWIWGALIPILALGPAWWTHGWSLILLAVYPLQFFRLQLRNRKIGMDSQEAGLFARFCLLSKFPQVLGQIKYWYGRVFGRPSQLIEYKGAVQTNVVASAEARVESEKPQFEV